MANNDNLNPNGVDTSMGTAAGKPIIYVEPNAIPIEDGKTESVTLIKGTDGRMFDKMPNTEDYSIYVDLEVEVKNRYGGVANQGNRTFFISWDPSKGESVNFMGGQKYTFYDRYNERSYNAFTTDYADYCFSDKNPYDNAMSEMFGIRSIDISYDNYYVPQITIEFVDIRGISLFGPEDGAHSSTQGGVDGVRTKNIGGSLFSSFFTFPYPMFKLRVKGYYGAPITYELNMTDWKANIDCRTGNFGCTATFIGYSFALLTDITFNMLCVAPLTSTGSKYWTSRGGTGAKILETNSTEVSTSELNDNENNTEKSAKDANVTKDKKKSTNTGSTKTTEVKEKEPTSIIATTTGFDNGDNAADSFVFANSGDNLITFKDFLDRMQAANKAVSSATQSMAETKDIASVTSDNDKYQQVINGIKDIENSFATDADKCGLARLNSEKLSNVGCVVFYSQKNGNENIDSLNKYNDKIANLNKTIVTGSANISGKILVQTTFISSDNLIAKFQGDNSLNDIKNKKIVYIDPSEPYKSASEKIENNNNVISEDKQSIQAQSDSIRQSIIGFTPSVQNFMKMLCAHVETLMYMIESCVNSIYEQNKTNSQQRSMDAMNLGDTDVPQKEGVPPFPKVSAQQTSSNGTKMEDAWLGDVAGDTPETQLVEELLAASNALATKLPEYQASLDGTNNGDGTSDSTVDTNLYVMNPNVPSDFYVEKNDMLFGDMDLNSPVDSWKHLLRRFILLEWEYSDNVIEGADGNKMVGDWGLHDAYNFHQIYSGKKDSLFISNILKGVVDKMTSISVWMFEQHIAPLSFPIAYKNEKDKLSESSLFAIHLEGDDVYKKVDGRITKYINDNYNLTEYWDLINSVEKKDNKVYPIMDLYPALFGTGDGTIELSKGSILHVSQFSKYPTCAFLTALVFKTYKTEKIVSQLKAIYHSYRGDNKIQLAKVSALVGCWLASLIRGGIEIIGLRYIFTENKTYIQTQNQAYYATGINSTQDSVYGWVHNLLLDGDFSKYFNKQILIAFNNTLNNFDAIIGDESKLKNLYTQYTNFKNKQANTKKYNTDINKEKKEAYENSVEGQIGGSLEYAQWDTLQGDKYAEKSYEKEPKIYTKYNSIILDLMSKNVLMYRFSVPYKSETLTKCYKYAYAYPSRPKTAICSQRLNQYFHSFIINVYKLFKADKGEASSTDASSTSDTTNNNDPNPTTAQTTDLSKVKEAKIAMYAYLKLIYDRWISGTSSESLKRWTLGELYKKHFKFIDSFYYKIGNEAIIDPQDAFQRMLDSLHQETYTTVSFINDLFQKNNMTFLSVQNFEDLSNPETFKKAFTPIPYDNSFSEIEPQTDFICLYTYEGSHIPGGNGDYESESNKDMGDSFLIKSDENLESQNLPEVITSKNEANGYTMPCFGVSFGKQYQSYFQNIQVNMDSPTVTEQVVRTQFAMGNMANAQQGEYYLGQDLFTIYSNNSYQCTITMMGCGWIQPMMYFSLNNIPLFRGTYMIFKASHHIEPGLFTTTFTGNRMARVANPLVKTWCIGGSGADASGAIDLTKFADVGNDCPYLQFVPSSMLLGTEQFNKCVSELIPYSHKIANMAFKESGEFETAAAMEIIVLINWKLGKIKGSTWDDVFRGVNANDSAEYGKEAPEKVKNFVSSMLKNNSVLSVASKAPELNGHTDYLCYLDGWNGEGFTNSESLKINGQLKNSGHFFKMKLGKQTQLYGGIICKSDKNSPYWRNTGENTVNSDEKYGGKPMSKSARGLWRAIKATCEGTPSLNQAKPSCTPLSQNDFIVNCSKNGYKVFDMIVSTYFEYCKKIYWYTTSGNVKGEPTKIGIEASENTNGNIPSIAFFENGKILSPVKLENIHDSLKKTIEKCIIKKGNPNTIKAFSPMLVKGSISTLKTDDITNCNTLAGGNGGSKVSSKPCKDNFSGYQGIKFTQTICPITGNTVTVKSPYGQRRDPFGGTKSDFHPGLDLSTGKKTINVRAIANGVVVKTGTSNGYGRMTQIVHPSINDGKGHYLYSLYGHMQENGISVGSNVSAGQVIGFIPGNYVLGHSTGPHLHFGISVASYDGKAGYRDCNFCDPANFYKYSTDHIHGK
jgi:murein DD-endopeptidase MepM/ murein hydrolase activator NlpD